MLLVAAAVEFKTFAVFTHDHDDVLTPIIEYSVGERSIRRPSTRDVTSEIIRLSVDAVIPSTKHCNCQRRA